MRVGCTVGPTSRRSFKDTSVEDFAEASKTALIFVVVFELL